jgi:hypothetical protein
VVIDWRRGLRHDRICEQFIGGLSVSSYSEIAQQYVGSPVEGHHAQACFNWHAKAPGATEPAYVGFDVIAIDGRRVRQVYGFIDKTPSS